MFQRTKSIKKVIFLLFLVVVLGLLPWLSFAQTLRINTITASRKHPELTNPQNPYRQAIYNNCRLAICHQTWSDIYESCFSATGSRIFACHITLSAQFLINSSYIIKLVDPQTSIPLSGIIPVGEILKLEIEKPIGEWVFAGGFFDTPPISWLEDAQAGYNQLKPIEPLYEYEFFYSKYFPGKKPLTPKVGVAANDPLKKDRIEVVTNDKFEIFKENNEYYFRAIKPGVGNVEVSIPQLFAYATIDNLWFEKGFIPGASQSFTFSIIEPINPPVADAGPDKEVFEGQTTILEGSGSDPEDRPITFSWSCVGGILSDPNIAQPTYTAPLVDRETTYECTLTVTNDGGASASDSMSVLVKKNRPPEARNLSVRQESYCFAPHPPVFLSWEFYDPDPGDSQSAYQVQIASENDPDFSSPVIDSGKVASPSETYVPLELLFDTSYHWRVKVWDSQDSESQWAMHSFKTEFCHPHPDFDWLPFEPSLNEIVQFTDLSHSYEGAIIVSWSWKFENGDPATSTQQHPLTRFIDRGPNNQNNVALTVTDNNNNSCFVTKPVAVRLPPPWWREILPF